LKRILIIVFWIAVVALVLNDGGRYAQGVIDLRTSTGQVLDSAALVAPKLTQTQLGEQIGALAATQGIRVTQFAIGPTGVTLWTEEDIKDTWVIGPYLAVSHGVPVQQAFATPIVVTYQATAALR
jgi:broad specificity polyphosphatase/5'/3'-nucleotidase SurE